MGRPPGSKNSGKKAAPKKAAKKGAKTQAATTPETPREAPAMQAHNNGPTAIEKRQCLEEYRRGRRNLADIMSDAADARGNIKSILKSFESKGGNPKMLIRMFQLTDMTQGEAEAEIAEYLGYAVDIGIRVTFDASGQGSLVDVLDEAPKPVKPTVEAEEALSRSRSYGDGWNTAQAGGATSDNKFLAGTAEHQEWHKGYSDWLWEQEHGKPGNGAAVVAAPPVEGFPADPG